MFVLTINACSITLKLIPIKYEGDEGRRKAKGKKKITHKMMWLEL